MPSFRLITSPLSEEQASALLEEQGAPLGEDITGYFVQVTISGISARGSVVVGTALHIWQTAEDPTHRHWAAHFVWTAQSGSQPLPFQPDVVSADGSTVFGHLDDPAGGATTWHRWDEHSGSEPFDTPEGFTGFITRWPWPANLATRSDSVSIDGAVVLGRSAVDTVSVLRWESATAWNAVAMPTTETDLTYQMNQQGDVVLGSSDALWTLGGSVPIDAPCRATSLAPDGTAVGSCNREGTSNAFRLLPDASFAEIAYHEPYVSLWPSLISSDGATVILESSTSLAVPDLADYYLWTPPGDPTPLSQLDHGINPDAVTSDDRTSIALLGLQQDGSTLFGNFTDEFPGNDITAGNSFPLRWSATAGREDLIPPAGYENAWGVSYSTDGAVLAGFAFDGAYYAPPGIEGVRQARSSGAITVWDEAGPRVLADELADRVPDASVLLDATSLLVEHSPDAIVIIGTSAVPHPGVAWVAAIPNR